MSEKLKIEHTYDKQNTLSETDVIITDITKLEEQLANKENSEKDSLLKHMKEELKDVSSRAGLETKIKSIIKEKTTVKGNGVEIATDDGVLGIQLDPTLLSQFTQFKVNLAEQIVTENMYTKEKERMENQRKESKEKGEETPDEEKQKEELLAVENKLQEEYELGETEIVNSETQPTSQASAIKFWDDPTGRLEVQVTKFSSWMEKLPGQLVKIKESFTAIPGLFTKAKDEVVGAFKKITDKTE